MPNCGDSALDDGLYTWIAWWRPPKAMVNWENVAHRASHAIRRGGMVRDRG